MRLNPASPGEKATEYETVPEVGACILDSLPNPWTMHIHPEGAKFYVNSLINVVTDSNITMPDIHDKIARGIRGVQNLLSTTLGYLSKQTELYISAETEENQCDYYFIDHDNQTEFWAESMNAAHLGLEQACSLPHISEQTIYYLYLCTQGFSWFPSEYALQEHYWTHVEYFPHRPVSKDLRMQLVNILRHGQLGMYHCIS